MSYHSELAREAIGHFLADHRILPILENLPAEFYEKKYGVFVSLYKNGELRSCIGTYFPQYKNLAEEIVQNAVAAATRDYRFSPVTIKEIDDLQIEVSLLNKPEKIKSLNDLDEKKYGVIIKSPDGRCGLLLPDLLGVESVEQQISIACQKAGINSNQEKNIEISRFEVKKYQGKMAKE